MPPPSSSPMPHIRSRPCPLAITTFLAGFLLISPELFGTVDGFSSPLQQTIETTGRLSRKNCGVMATKLFVGRGIDDSDRQGITPTNANNDDTRDNAVRSSQENERDEATASLDQTHNKIPPSALWETLTGKGPPLDVDDTNLLLYDVFLLTNLSVSISFFVVHRLNANFIPSSLNEGALLSICWIIAGLANGSFLRSAVDGHYDPTGDDYAEKGGPRGAGLLALSTFVTTSSLRIVIALATAVAHHRQVGASGSGEELIPLEILFGLVLMSAWRTLHSANTPRI